MWLVSSGLHGMKWMLAYRINDNHRGRKPGIEFEQEKSTNINQLHNLNVQQNQAQLIYEQHIHTQKYARMFSI